MARGRPKKYFTVEERHQAKRERSQRSYERRKEEINRKRRERYREVVKRKHKALADEERELNDTPADPNLRERLAQMSLGDAIDGAKLIFEDFERLIKVPPKSFMKSVTEAYLDLYTTLPESAGAMVENYYKKMRRYEVILTSHRDRVWNLVGIGKEYNEVDKLLKCVLEVIVWIEDLQCAELDPELSVSEMFCNKKFAFQD